MDDVLLGLDIGTSRIKGVLATPDGRVISKASQDYPIDYPRPGWAEQNPLDWWSGVVQVVRALRSQARVRVAGIGVSGQGCAVTLIGSDGHVIRPAIIWVDTRSEPQCERLRRCCDAEILARNGKIPAPYNADPVLMWLMENEPDSIGAAETSLTTTAYINFRLTGQKIANLSDASILIAFDLEEKGWSDPLIESIGVPRRLYPALSPCDQVIGSLSSQAAADLGLEAGLPVVAGGEDTSSAGLASGAVRTGQTYLSLGTAGTLYVPVDRKTVHPQLLTFLHVLAGHYLLGGSMVALGASLAWCRKLLDPQIDFEKLIELAAQSEPGAGRLLFLPYLSGELQPINDGYARGMLFGLSLSTEKADLVRAILEGTAFAIAHNLSMIEALGIPITEIRAVGNPTRSAEWCQIIANISGRPLNVMADEAGAPLGNALLAAKGAGLIRDPAQAAQHAARIEHSYEPSPELVERYKGLFEIYRQLYPQVKEQYAQLSLLGSPGFRGMES
ncbi:MAG TPA: FGGY family carbohydrate kinase [Anaerolineales bacterium]